MLLSLSTEKLSWIIGNLSKFGMWSEHRWHIRLTARGPLFCSSYILTSSAICFWTDARQRRSYFLMRKRWENQSYSRIFNWTQLSGYYQTTVIPVKILHQKYYSNWLTINCSYPAPQNTLATQVNALMKSWIIGISSLPSPPPYLVDILDSIGLAFWCNCYNLNRWEHNGKCDDSLVFLLRTRTAHIHPDLLCTLPCCRHHRRFGLRHYKPRTELWFGLVSLGKQKLHIGSLLWISTFNDHRNPS